jgi:hypothetical protein
VGGKKYDEHSKYYPDELPCSRCVCMKGHDGEFWVIGANLSFPTLVFVLDVYNSSSNTSPQQSQDVWLGDVNPNPAWLASSSSKGSLQLLKNKKKPSRSGRMKLSACRRMVDKTTVPKKLTRQWHETPRYQTKILSMKSYNRRILRQGLNVERLSFHSY